MPGCERVELNPDPVDLDIRWGSDADDHSDQDPNDKSDRGNDIIFCTSHKVFLDSNNNVRTLMAMCVGLNSKDQKRKLADFDGEDPMCKNLPDKSAYEPTVPMLRKEVKRRATLFKVTVTSSTMSHTAAVQWLTENPISNVRGLAAC